MNGQSREDTSLKLWQQKGRSIDRNRFHLLSFGNESPILYGGFIMAKGRSGGGKGPGKGAMTGKAAARVQAAEAKANGGQNPKGGFAARAQRAAAKNSG